MPIIQNAKGLVDINGLNETANLMREELMLLPIVYNKDYLRRMGVDMIGGIQNKLTAYNYIRYGGLMRPYYPGFEARTSPVGKIEENVLQVYLTAGIDKDNIQNYTQFALGDINLLGSNKTYRNPMNALILYSLMKTWSEDLVDAYMFAKRKPDGDNKYDSFDGIYTHILNDKASGKIAENLHNLIPTGPITAPITDNDSEVYKIVNEFLQAAHPTLTQTPSLLLVTSQFSAWLQEAIANKFKNTVTPDQYGNLRIPGWPNVTVVPCLNMGMGDLMILTKVNNLRLGFDSLSDDEYVRVRSIDDDANILTYNIQARYGTNIRFYNPKMFAINDGSLRPVAYAGDENGPANYTVSVTAGSNGTVEVSPQKEKYALGDIITATAVPSSESYEFEKWSDNTMSNPYKFMVMGDKTLSATFKSKA